VTDGYRQQEGTAAADHTGHPVVVHNRPLVRNLAVDLRRSLAAVRNPVEAGLNSTVCVSMYNSN
jgi:hypothetical protein